MGREVMDALDAFECCPYSTGIEQVELPGSWCAHVVTGRLEEGQERAAEHANSSGDEQLHRL
jgi:hypothetical protein